MADICIACENALATVTPQCGHRQYCAACFEQTQNQNNGAQNCALCRRSTLAFLNTTAHQLLPVTLAESLNTYDSLKKDYPFGCLLFGTNPITRTPNDEVYKIVKEAMEAVDATKLELSELKKALRSRLTMEQYQIVFVELIKHEDLHKVLKQLDKRKFETRTTVKKVQQMIVRTIESPDSVAIASRAAVATVGSAGFDLLTYGLTGFGSAGFGACAVSNSVMFSFFTAIEIYQWSKGLRSGTEVVKNIGEHAVGNTCGAVGAFGGFKLGAVIGTFCAPGVGTVIGGVIGSIIGGLICDGSGRAIYRHFVPGKQTETIEENVTEEHVLTPQELAEKAASKFHININYDTFEEAQAKYRRHLLANHPDKHPDVSEEKRKQLTAETADILACWNIIREYYQNRGDEVESDCEEGFVKIFAYQIFDKATQQWHTVRTFFDHVSFGREIDPTKEKLEEMVIYV